MSKPRHVVCIPHSILDWIKSRCEHLSGELEATNSGWELSRLMLREIGRFTPVLIVAGWWSGPVFWWWHIWRKLPHPRVKRFWDTCIFDKNCNLRPDFNYERERKILEEYGL